MRQCEEAVFMAGLVRIAVAPDLTWGADHPRSTARLFVAEPGTVRPIVDAGGHPIEIAAESAALALRSAVSFLEREFGTFTQMMHPCTDDKPVGEPYVASRYRVQPSLPQQAHQNAPVAAPVR